MVRLSIREVEGLSKKDREAINIFHHYWKVPFKQLTGLLKKDYIYNPFAFMYFQRLTKYIRNTARFVIIDVDTTNVSLEQRYEQLADEGLIFIIATTSDTSNLYKYRVLFLLNREVTPDEYRSLVTGIEKYGLIVDLDVTSRKPAQPFYAYKGSIVMEHTDGVPLAVDDYLVESSETTIYSDLDPTELINNFDSEFRSYTRAIKGSRTRNLLSAGYTMLNNGFTKEQLTEGVYRINSKFIIPKPEREVKRRVIDYLLNS